jgi:hypothetical protein
MSHINYPHEPGYLYDCQACESKCNCAAGRAQCVYCNNADEQEEWEMSNQGDETDSGETIVLDEELKDDSF